MTDNKTRVCQVRHHWKTVANMTITMSPMQFYIIWGQNCTAQKALQFKSPTHYISDSHSDSHYDSLTLTLTLTQFFNQYLSHWDTHTLFPRLSIYTSLCVFLSNSTFICPSCLSVCLTVSVCLSPYLYLSLFISLASSVLTHWGRVTHICVS